MSSFNEEQKLAISSKGNGAILVVAGAGTGKTTVLTQRINYLINKLLFDEKEILAITFTNKAANEMKERLLQNNISLEWIGTFHAISIKLLKIIYKSLNKDSNFTIINEDDSLMIIRQIFKNLNIETNSINPKRVMYCINNFKSKENIVGFSEDVFKELLNKNPYDLTLKLYSETIKEVWKVYEEELRKNNYLDFNDILNYIVDIIKKNENIRKYVSNKFQYILVDEFQDTNNIQFEFLNLITNQDKNIFVVGDSDQSIYSFRGSNPIIIKKFIEKFDPNIIVLNQNYRSNQEILDASNSLIEKNKDRISKQLKSLKTSGKKPIYLNSITCESEVEWIVKKIKENYETEKNYRNNTILLRSNYLSRVLEQSFILNDIPYKIWGGIKFYDRTEIKDIISYLKFLNNNDDLSLERIINIPNRKIGDVTLNKINNLKYKNNKKIIDILLNEELIKEELKGSYKKIKEFVDLIKELKEFKYNSINDLIEFILKKINYIEYREQKDLNRINTIKENIEELKNSIKKFEENSLDKSLENYLSTISLYNDNNEKEEDTVMIMTVHASKGLEFKNVFIPFLIEGIFPSSKSIEDDSEVLEERRIAYVAITRAKNNLYLSNHKIPFFKTWETTNNEPSRFINDIGLSNLDIIREVNVNKANNSLKKEWFDSSSDNKINISESYSKELKNDFKINELVSHITFGVGKIIDIENDNLVIEFKKPIGIKKIIYNHKSIRRM